MREAVLAAALAAAACVPDPGPLMQPGQDCLSCHGSSARARAWTIAGTVYDSIDAEPNQGILGALVEVTDANGFTITLRTNEAGNFYTAEPLAFPLRGDQVCVVRGSDRTCMESDVLAGQGSCNRCHTFPGLNSAPGRLAPH